MLADPYSQKKCQYRGGFVTTFEVLVGSTTLSIKSPKIATAALRVQRMTVHVLTGAAGKTWALAAVSGSPILTPALDASVSGSVYSFDYGAAGVAFAVNDPVRLTISAAGAVGRIVLEGYQV